MTETPKPVEVTQAPTHYCVVCAARWVKHSDDTWSVQTNCGPCCDNVPMDKAPLIEFRADGSLSGRDHERVKGSYDAARRREQVERYRGIACAICDEPFERHLDNWRCPRRVKQSFKFLADTRPEAQSLPTVSGAIAALIRFHETGGHEGDGSDETLTKAKVELAALSPTVNEADELVERTDSGLVADMLTSAAHQPHTRAFTNAQIIEAFVALQAAALRQPSNEAEGWRDIASAPKDGTVVDLWVEDGRWANMNFNGGAWRHSHWSMGKPPSRKNMHMRHEVYPELEPTHWRPLSAAPGEASVQAGGEVERLREALKKIARKTSITFGSDTMSGEEAAAIARAALNSEGSDHAG